jgi:tetratricopeptide (TPR) repeat protein
LGLSFAVAAAFSPVLHCEFVDYDDNEYVFANPHVRAGLTRDGFLWAWTTAHAANWHPLTWLSHMLDCQLFGVNPHGHHFVNLLWHIANTIGLFWVLRRMTGEDLRPALVAALFGLHPLHVESVAWVAERKDVLSTFFAVLTLGAYTAYTARPGLWRYLAVMLLFALGLLAKPMLVTLPCVLLLLDYWPLRRCSRVAAGAQTPRFSPASWGRLVIEKLPLLALSAVSCLLTVRAQSEALVSVTLMPMGIRLANAVAAYATYLRKTIWPTDLAVFYQHPGDKLPLARVVAAALVLILLSALALSSVHRRPAILVGWLWYLGMLVPVLGLVQVGSQALADRYTYLPLVGIFLALGWALPLTPASRPMPQALAGGLAVGMLAVCVALTWRQALYWRDDETLWQRVFQVDDNPMSHRHWANVLVRHGFVDEAEEQLRAALRMDPDFAPALLDLGNCLLHQGDIDGALALFARGSAVDPRLSSLRNAQGIALICKGQTEEACRQFRAARDLRPEIAEYHYNLATALARLGDRARAEAEYQEGRRLNPDWPQHQWQLALLLRGDEHPKWNCPAEALFHAEQACQGSSAPRPEMYQTLADALARVGRLVAARAAARKALDLAEADGLAELLPGIRAQMRFYDALAQRCEIAGAAALAAGMLALPAAPSPLPEVSVLMIAANYSNDH